MCAIVRTVDAAPQIDIELAATEIPAWSSRVGAEIDENLVQPSAPRFAGLTSGTATTGVANRITVALEPGSGAVTTAAFQLEHRLASAPGWTVVSIPAASGGGDIDSYAIGQLVQLRARGVSATGVLGPYSPTVTITVGTANAGLPSALPGASISVSALLGGALVQFTTGTDANTTRVQVYRSTSATLDRETDAVGSPITVSAQQAYSTTLGDATRANLIVGGAMDSAVPWTAGAGWSVAAGVASHVTGAAGSLSQALAATAGKFYRLGLMLTGRTAGTLQPCLSGGSDRLGTALAANGLARDRIQAVTGNATFELRASADFVGSVDDVIAYLETDTCLSAGTHYVWLEPQNANGSPGPLSGPYALEII